MTTFAENNITFADGQNSVENFPQEMAWYGFVPPLRTASGQLTEGDVLTAQWFNSIFRDCFRAQKQLQSFTVPDDAITIVNATDSASIQIKVGALLLVLATVDTGGATGAITIPTGASFKGQPFMMAIDNAEGAALRRVVMEEAAAAAGIVTKFNPRATLSATPGTEDPARGGAFTALFIGEYDGTSPTAPVNSTFAEFDRLYPDGQTVWTSPSADQWNNGFVPTHQTTTGAIVKGDQLAANVLNFVLCDLFRKGGRGDVVNGGYVLQVGALKMQFWKSKILSGGDRVAFPEPFRKGFDPFVAASVAQLPSGSPVSAIAGASVGRNTQDPNNRHALTGRVIYWNTSTTPISVDGDVAFMAFGLGDRQVSLQRFYDSFASNAVSYPDGQSNTTTLTPALLDSGFKPPVRNADGSITKGDTVTAQDINTLFKLAYVDAGATLAPVGGQFVELNSINGWQGVENSKTWIAWKTVSGLLQADWTGGLKVSAPYPTKTSSKLFAIASDTAENDHAIIGLAGASVTNSQAVFNAAKYATPSTAATPSAVRVVMFGVKP